MATGSTWNVKAALDATGIGVYGNTMTQIADANDAVPTGFYSTNTSTVNLPSSLPGNSRQGMIMTIARGDYAYQQYVEFYQYNIYERYRKNNVWTNWNIASPILGAEVTASVSGA